MRMYKYTFYDSEGNEILTNTCVSETMFQYDYNQWFKNPIFHRAEIEIVSVIEGKCAIRR